MQSLTLYITGSLDKTMLKKLGKYIGWQNCLYISTLEDVDKKVVDQPDHKISTEIESSLMDRANNTNSNPWTCTTRGVGKVPKYVWQMLALETLNLADNGLTSLSEEIGNLAHLTMLDLGHNRLSSSRSHRQTDKT